MDISFKIKESNSNFSLSNPLFLSKDVKMFEVDDETLLFHGQTRKYYKIGKIAKELISQLQTQQSTGEQLVKEISIRFDVKTEEITKNVNEFLKQMIEEGIICTNEGRFDRNKSVHSQRSNKALIKLIKMKNFDRYLSKLSSLLPTMSIKATAVFFILMSVISIVSIISVLRSNYVAPLSGIEFFYLLPWITLHLIGHELSHALVCKKLGGDVREIGFGLLYLVIPVAYVDLTDTYQLKSNKRAFIAVTDPVYDLTMAFISSLFVLYLDGFPKTIAVHFLLIQFMIFCFNCNLLLPSDLYKALENWFKVTNLRNHSLEYLKFTMMNKEKPAYLKGISGIKENFYLLYAILSLFYIASLIFIFVFYYFKIFFD
ncbi:PqqD family peptide modification chaperone [Geobacillus icigianus]|uniref:Peptidase M50 domain-containing protein n=1 Tax=Geobacillus subterraneus TaxID=129338 RepID=A0A679G0B7_9BACL|nr:MULTISPECIES: PqqD family peptide modification chaperone [Geobacillus]KYD29103.1 hypothetical protein B4113_2470 [Geobacillus sp. B4113_201601]BBW98534.1 hypothetical protein GsuE55_33670 [Geobacillus subterraneus]